MVGPWLTAQTFALRCCGRRLNWPTSTSARWWKAEASNPQNPEYPYARATIHLQQGDRQRAAQAATRALEIQPAFPAARQLLRQL